MLLYQHPELVITYSFFIFTKISQLEIKTRNNLIT